MQIYTVPAGMLRANSYIITENGTDAVLIDCGGAQPLAFARQKGLNIRSVLLTHGHFDHIAGCAELQAAGAQIGCAEAEKSLLTSPANLAAEMGVRIPAFSVDFTFQDGDELDLCGLKFTVLATPGLSLIHISEPTRH